jgi:hypothetical protein
VWPRITMPTVNIGQLLQDRLAWPPPPREPDGQKYSYLVRDGAFLGVFGDKRALQTVTKVDYKFSLSRIRSIH